LVVQAASESTSPESGATGGGLSVGAPQEVVPGVVVKTSFENGIVVVVVEEVLVVVDELVLEVEAWVVLVVDDVVVEDVVVDDVVVGGRPFL
jgi:hypothetical protein